MHGPTCIFSANLTPFWLKWVQFDGNLPHCTMPYRGTRYTLIYFIQRSYNDFGKRPNGKPPNGSLARGAGDLSHGW